MKNLILGCAMLAVVMPAHASEENLLVILGEPDPLNVHAITLEGTGNRLEITQQHSGFGGQNLITGSITGVGNGGPEGSSFTGAALVATGLRPGSLTQNGFDNRMTITVAGSHNLFAFAQNGSGNALSASMTGTGNQAAVVQAGINNFASFSQNGVGNMISIMQRSW